METAHIFDCCKRICESKIVFVINSTGGSFNAMRCRFFFSKYRLGLLFLCLLKCIDKKNYLIDLFEEKGMCYE